jgi:hypothetical protein
VSLDDRSKERRASLWLPTLGIALATPFLVWFAVGDVSFGGPGRLGNFHELGPYTVGPESGYVVGGVAAVVALVAFAVLVLRTREGAVNWWWWAAVVILAGAGSVGAIGWRVATAGVVGANIGGGFALILGPLMIAGLLVLAVWLAYVAGQESARSGKGSGRRHALRWAWLLTVAALLVAPGLYAVEGALFRYERALSKPSDVGPGLISPRQYADVRSGQTQAAVQKTLWPEFSGWDDEYFPRHYPTPTAGLVCDDYLNGEYTIAYRFCFRDGVLVSKASEEHDPSGATDHRK